MTGRMEVRRQAGQVSSGYYPDNDEKTAHLIVCTPAAGSCRHNRARISKHVRISNYVSVNMYASVTTYQ